MQILALALIHSAALLQETTKQKSIGGKKIEKKSKPRILLADDNEQILSFIPNVFGEQFEVVGAVRNGEEAIAAVNNLRPDVLILDITMPVLDGIQTAVRLKKASSPTKIAFLTAFEDDDYVDAALAFGGHGFVFKAYILSDLMKAVSEALAGRIFVSLRK